ncbi:Aldo/keto reductase [Exidia glandulosa HHB12029]|uniref:Aldo/keto reductase n=1 Tax=Exidia glandulosa HHB12029 TaxID=1314781 RepID=A0A165EUG4_EXIGL|nr:Aldo/keto reductase [Exidia glandulosa HHB12029]
MSTTRQLGRNGPTVSGIGLGLMGLSTAYPPVPTEEQTFALLDKAIELGCTFWDSSDVYGDNSERLKAYFEKTGNRDKVFLCTKFGITFGADGSFTSQGDAKYVRSATEKVLGRLGLPYVDLLYQHRVDPATPIEITVGAMAELVKEGKVRHLGLSECSAATLRRAHAVHPIAAVQVEYSPFALEIEENDLLKTCRELGVAIVAYSPVGRGLLTGQIRSRADFDPTDFRAHLPRFSEENFDKNLALVDKFAELAKKRGVPVGQFTLAWIASQGKDIISIPGTTKVSRLEENFGALKVEVTKEEDKQIREILTTLEGGRYPESMSGPYLYGDTPALNA